MSKSRSQPGRKLRFEMCQPRLDVRTVRLAEFLETKYPYILVAGRHEGPKRKRRASASVATASRSTSSTEAFAAATRSRVDLETSNKIVTARSRWRRAMVRNTRSSGRSTARIAIAASRAALRSRSGPSLRRFSRWCQPILAPRTRRRIRARTAGIPSSAVSMARGSPGHTGAARTVVQSGRSVAVSQSHSG